MKKKFCHRIKRLFPIRKRKHKTRLNLIFQVAESLWGKKIFKKGIFMHCQAKIEMKFFKFKKGNF